VTAIISAITGIVSSLLGPVLLWWAGRQAGQDAARAAEALTASAIVEAERIAEAGFASGKGDVVERMKRREF